MFNHSEAQESQVLHKYRECETLVPNGIEGVAMDGFGTEVAPICLHAQNIHLDTGTTTGVSRTYILTRDNLKKKERPKEDTQWVNMCK